MQKAILLLVMILAPLLMALPCVGAEKEELQVSVSRPGLIGSYQVVEEGRLLASFVDEDLQLSKEDFSITMGSRTAEILAVEDLVLSVDVGLNIVYVLDNSLAMEQKGAAEPLLEVVTELISFVRPIDQVSIVVFDETAANGPGAAGPQTRTFTSNDPQELETFMRDSYYQGMTTGSYLHDAMLAGLGILQELPEESQKIMVILAGGEDLHSQAEFDQVATAAQGLTSFQAHVVDYGEGPQPDPRLAEFAAANYGTLRQAEEAIELLPILIAMSTMNFQLYMVDYRFLEPPHGGILMTPTRINLEEAVVIDSSPLLNKVYFERGSSRLSERYVQLADRGLTVAWAQAVGPLRDGLEKHHQLLNIIGQRLRDTPGATIELVGRAEIEEEHAQADLSSRRAEAVSAYLTSIWQIEPARIVILARSRAAGAISRCPGDNQLVEIRSSNQAILDSMPSTYVERVIDTREVVVTPVIFAEAGVKNWKIILLGDDKPLAQEEVHGPLPEEMRFFLEPARLEAIASLRRLAAILEVTDQEGNTFAAKAVDQVTIDASRGQDRGGRQPGDQLAERCALLLFEFDQASVQAHQRPVVDLILAQMRDLEHAVLAITGHTDTVGSAEYNLKLSQARAAAVLNLLQESGLPAGIEVAISGVGEQEPLYDNALPEGRALNRNVVINLTAQRPRTL